MERFWGGSNYSITTKLSLWGRDWWTHLACYTDFVPEHSGFIELEGLATRWVSGWFRSQLFRFQTQTCGLCFHSTLAVLQLERQFSQPFYCSAQERHILSVYLYIVNLLHIRISLVKYDRLTTIQIMMIYSIMNTFFGDWVFSEKSLCKCWTWKIRKIWKIWNFKWRFDQIPEPFKVTDTLSLINRVDFIHVSSDNSGTRVLQVI